MACTTETPLNWSHFLSLRVRDTRDRTWPIKARRPRIPSILIHLSKNRPAHQASAFSAGRGAAYTLASGGRQTDFRACGKRIPRGSPALATTAYRASKLRRRSMNLPRRRDSQTRQSAASATWPAMISPSLPAETGTVSPSLIWPLRIICASAFCSWRWITRFSGRAP